MEELIKRALAVGLPETATEAEIIEAETDQGINNTPPVVEDEKPVVEETPAASETATEVDKTRSLALIEKHGNGQMNENHLPGHFARNLASKMPAEIKDKLTSTELKIKTDELEAIIKDMLYGEAEENDGLLTAMEEMPVGGYGF